MNKARILSIGTMYVDINCIHFPFQKGLFVNRETTGNEYMLQLGGSALNFAKLTTQLHLETTFIGKVGNDEMGRLLLQLLKQDKIHPAIVTDPKAQTNLAVHYIHEDGSSIMTSTGTANQRLDIVEIEDQMDLYIDSIDYLYLGGVFKLKKLLPFFPRIAKYAKEKGKVIVLDHGRVNNNVTKDDITALHQLLPYVDIYLPSIDEFLDVWDAKTIDEGIKKMQHISNPTVVIKQGSFGAIGIKEDTQVEVEAFTVDAINTVGAGDSFNAGFLRGMSDGLIFVENIEFACATAALKISTTTNFTEVDVYEKYTSTKIDVHKGL